MGFLGLLEVCFGGQHRAVRPFFFPQPLQFVINSSPKHKSVAFLPRIVAASLGHVRLCGVKFWHNLGVCVSVEVVLGVPWISGNVLRGVGIGQYDLSSSLLNPAM